MPALRRGRGGDQIVVVNVVIPRNLSDEQRDLLERLSATLDAAQPRGGERRGAVREGQAGVPLIRLAVRAAADDAEAVLAALLELAPSGLEQVDGEGWVEYALYGAPGELPSLPEGEAEVGGRRVQRARRGGARRLGRALEALPRPGARRRPPVRPPALGAARRAPARDGDRDRPRPGVRHRLAPDDAALPRADARARAGGLVRRPRLRLRRAGDRRGEARLRPGRRVRLRCRGDRGDARERARQRGRRSTVPSAGTCAATRRRRRTRLPRT